MEETEIISVSETGFESQLSAGKNEIADENGKPDNPDEESLTVIMRLWQRMSKRSLMPVLKRLSPRQNSGVIFVAGMKRSAH